MFNSLIQDVMGYKGPERERKEKGNPSRTEVCFCLWYALGPFSPCVPLPALHAGAGLHPGPWSSFSLGVRPCRNSGLMANATAGDEDRPSSEGPGRQCRKPFPSVEGIPEPLACPVWGAVELGSAWLPVLWEMWALQ